MLHRIRVLPLLQCVALGVTLVPARSAVFAQQATGAVEGRVVDQENSRPIPGARVTITGTTLGAVTSEAGTFRVNGVPARQVTVGVRVIGFSPATKGVVVTAGQTARADFVIDTSRDFTATDRQIEAIVGRLTADA